MELWKAALLGLVQGLTEFFPVSSDGHLVALERWLDVRQDGSGASFEAFLHFGTLLACALAFRRDLVPLLRVGVFDLLPLPRAGGGAAVRAAWRRLFAPAPDDELGQEARFVTLGTLATVATALPSADWLESLYDVKAVIVLSLAATGLLLIASRWLVAVPTRASSWWQPIVVGICQTAAILPGLSRSCTTVVVGLLVGVGAARVARRSFLLSLPIVCGAVVRSAVKHPPTAELMGPLLVGNAVAFVVGLVAVGAMLSWVPRGRMHWFAPWCFAVAAAVWWGT